jgi:DNA invertase Pin-like site-specific DNA recombinase
MRAAIYARYSSDRQRDASIDDQFRNCIGLADREGWKVEARYRDEAISGGRADRPGYRKLVADAEARKFDVLIVDDLSRLSRDEVEMKQLIRRLRFWNIRIIGVSDGFDSASKGAKVQATFRSLMNDMYLDDLREKTYRGLAGQALKGNNCGGRSYGYRHVPITDSSRLDEYGRPTIVAVRREIDPEQAKWVRQIFEWTAIGRAPRWIASELNRLKVPSPNGGTWAASAIYGHVKNGTGILCNELYIGRYVWGRSHWIKNPDTGRRKRVLRPASEWIVTSLPELRIVPHELWDRVNALQAQQVTRSTAIRTALHKNARTGAGPKYLFSGLLKCACCGANYIMCSATHYGCSTNINRGPNACSNAIRVARATAENRLLEAIKRDLFSEEALALFERETARLLSEAQADRARSHAQGRARLAEIEKEIANIMAAIRAGIITPTTKAALEEAEAERAKLKADAGAPAFTVKSAIRLPNARELYRELVDDLAETLRDHVSAARIQISALVGSEIKLHPIEGGYLEAELAGDYRGLLALINERPGAEAGAAKLSLVAGVRNHLYRTVVFALSRR